MTHSTGAIEAALAEGWREHVESKLTRYNACILAARVAHEVLDYFQVRHAVRPVFCVVFNEAAHAELQAGRPIDEWSADAWSVGGGQVVHEIAPDLPGWAGHLVVVTDSYVLDLSARQLDRPFERIETGGPLVLPQTAFEPASYPPFFAGIMATLPKHGRYLISPEPENTSYKQAPDWRTHAKTFVGPVIRHVRATL